MCEVANRNKWKNKTVALTGVNRPTVRHTGRMYMVLQLQLVLQAEGLRIRNQRRPTGHLHNAPNGLLSLYFYYDVLIWILKQHFQHPGRF